MFVQVKLEVEVELEVELKPKHSRKKPQTAFAIANADLVSSARERGEERGEVGQSPLFCVALIAPNFA